MGFNNYIGKISKERYGELNEMTLEQLKTHLGEEHDRSVLFSTIYEEVKMVYEFGKYFDRIDGEYKPFFKNESIWEIVKFDDAELFVVSKQFLADMITHYRTKVSTFYNNSVPDRAELNSLLAKFKRTYDDVTDEISHELKDGEELTKEELTIMVNSIKHMNDVKLEWTFDFLPFDLGKGPAVTNSSKYEYAIFELVRIYKTFDWTNDLLLYYGK